MVLTSFDVQRLVVGKLVAGSRFPVSLDPVGRAEDSRSAGGAAAGEVRKKEADGEHGAGDYLVVEDPERPETWRLRVRDAAGRLDPRLMGAAWAALHGGFRGRRYEGPRRQEAIAALVRLYRRVGMKTPDEGGGMEEGTPDPRRRGRKEGGPRFVAGLAEPPAKGVVRIPLAVTGTWARGEEKFSITRQDLDAIARNFARRRNGEINVDYDHASEMPEVAAGGPIPSAGRIVKIEPPEAAGERGDESRAPVFDAATPRLPAPGYVLWGWYEPTERARALIRRREYRYISPAIDWGAKSKRTGRPQGATLTSVALTNRPFLEELPQIHLSDPSYRLIGAGTGGLGAEGGGESRRSGGAGGAAPARLIDVGEVHVETSLPEEESRGPGAGSQEEESGEAGGAGRGPSPPPEGGDMKKVDVSAADGKVALSHPDFTDEYYADPEELRDILEEMGLPAEPAPAALNEIPLAQAASALSEAETRGKTVPAVEVFQARVEQALEEAVKAGKILPRQKNEWRRVALGDFATFAKLLSEQPARVPLRPIGFSSAGPADAAAQVKFLAEQRMRERGIPYGQALSELGREQPDLVRKYRRAVSGE